MALVGTEAGRARRPPPLDATVVRVEPRSGDFVRVVLGGGGLASFTWPGAASHLKLFPPGPPPAPGERATSRTYTPRAFDAARGELSIDVLVHGEGPGASFARAARPGDAVRVSVPRATYRVDPAATWVLLVGDDSALPAIATIIEDGLAVETRVIVETTAPGAGRAELPPHHLVRTEFVPADPAAPGRALASAVRAFIAPVGPGAVWVACEALAVRAVRTHLLDERGLARASVVTRGYWRAGRANHPDHDFGEELPES